MSLFYQTKLGKCYNTSIEAFLGSEEAAKLSGKINLIFTSPPFPLNRKKKYGNKVGNDYLTWLSEIMTKLSTLLTDDGSLVVEIGNSWEPGTPEMSTLPIESLLAIKKAGNLHLCQQFVWYNTAKLPSPAQWVTVDRVRVKDSFTNIWWLSKTVNPKANNKNVLSEYSASMKKLLKTGKYNSGARPSEHVINEVSFTKDNNGSIPSNVLISANTASRTNYHEYCKLKQLEPHPARMPAFLANFFIKMLTDEEDLVLDPFAGSNTTGEIAENLQRRWVGIEVDENYLKTSIGRFPQLWQEY